MEFKYVVVEGNIGSGKTTLAIKLAAYFQSKLVLEHFSENPYLPLFYEDRSPNALPLELFFLMDRVEELRKVDFNIETVVSDYSFEKSQIFSSVTLNDLELDLFKRVLNQVGKGVPEPDLFIYLHAPIRKLKENIEARGREYEKDMSGDYLEKIQNAYQPLIKKQSRVLVVPMDEVDFSTEPHFQQLIDFLEKDYDFSHHIFQVQ